MYLIRWLWDYLSNRSQYVVVNGSASNLVHVMSGVPQGSVLGPLLFLIYINDIADVSLTSGSLILHADDILLYRSIHSQHDFNLLQQDIDTLLAWCSQNASFIHLFNLFITICLFMLPTQGCFVDLLELRPLFMVIDYSTSSPRHVYV